MVLFSLFYYLPRVKPGPSVKAAQVQTASHPTHTSLSSPEGEGFCAAVPLNLHPLSAPLLERVWRQKHGKLRGTGKTHSRGSKGCRKQIINLAVYSEDTFSSFYRAVRSKFNKWNQLLKVERKLSF